MSTFIRYMQKCNVQSYNTGKHELINILISTQCVWM
jgi:hypothetical protein